MNVVMYAPAGRMIAFATRYAVITHVASSCVDPSPPAMCGNDTFAMELSSTSMNVASVTVIATIHGFTRGRHVAWESTGGETLSISATVAAAIRFVLGYYGLRRRFRKSATTRHKRASYPESATLNLCYEPRRPCSALPSKPT